MKMKKLLVSAAVVVTVSVGGLGSASAWKCEFHPEKPNCTPTTTVPVTTTTPSTTIPVTTTVPETTTTTTTTVPELAPPVSIDRPDTPIKLAG